MIKNDFELNEEKINNVLSLYKGYRLIKEKQSRRGLNDFNIFTSLLSMTDEVRLHSRFLYSLLDVSGEHGQDSLFLDLFIRECGLSDMDINTAACHVYKEYKHIDLYITDGNKHIIIENKIYASDGDKQIERYIEAIKDENKDDSEIHNNIVVLYLSLDRLAPSSQSLGDFEYNNDKLIKDNKEYSFISITYKKEILNWICEARKQVGNITNLSTIIKQYEDVILKLYNKYEGNLMTLKDYIYSGGKNDKIEVLHTIKALVSDYDDLKRDMVLELFDKIAIEMEVRISKNVHSGWEFKYERDKLQYRWNYPLRIQSSDTSKMFFAFEFDGGNFIDPYYGVVKRYEKDKNVDFSCCLDTDDYKKLVGSMNDTKFDVGNTTWLGWKYLYRGNIFDYILDKGGVNEAAKVISAELLDAFQAYKVFIMTCNEILDN